MESYGSVDRQTLGPLPVRFLSRKAAFVSLSACIVLALTLSVLVVVGDFEVEDAVVSKRVRSVLLEDTSKIAPVLGNAGNVEQPIQYSNAVRPNAASIDIDAELDKAKKNAAIAVAAAKSTEVSSDVYLAEAQKQAKIAIDIANGMENEAKSSGNSIDADLKAAKDALAIAQNAAGPVGVASAAGGGSAGIDGDLKAAQVAQAAAESAAGPQGPPNAGIDADLKAAKDALAKAVGLAPAAGVGGADPAAEAIADSKLAESLAPSLDDTDYSAEAKKYLAIAVKNAPDGNMDDADYAKKMAAVAIQAAGGAGGVEEAKAQAAIAIAAADGGNDFQSEARKAADLAMAESERSGKEVDWAAQAKTQMEIAIKAASSMGLPNVKAPESGEAAAASSAAAPTK